MSEILPATVYCNQITYYSDVPQFWVFLSVSLGLVLVGGLMSGLSVAFMSIDRLKLEVLKLGGTAEEKVMVDKVSPILENHHLLLVTLLFANAVAMEALPIALDYIVPSWAAIVLSVAFVLVFCEMIPQALCVTNPLQICAQTAWIVKLLQIVSYPVAYPMARILDNVLGDQSAHILFKRSELSSLIHLHASQVGSDGDGPLQTDEATVMKGALEFSHKCAADVMTAMEFVSMLELDRCLDLDTLSEILGMGHSRIPVFHKSRHNVKGLLLIKRLIVCNPDNMRPVQHFVHRRPLVVPPSLPLYELLNHFQTGQSHLAIVTNQTREYQWAMETGEDVAGYCRVDGIVTLEDVVEALIKEDIADEVDLRCSALARSGDDGVVDHALRQAGMERAKIVLFEMLRVIRERLAQRHRRHGAQVGIAVDEQNDEADESYSDDECSKGSQCSQCDVGDNDDSDQKQKNSHGGIDTVLQIDPIHEEHSQKYGYSAIHHHALEFANHEVKKKSFASQPYFTAETAWSRNVPRILQDVSPPKRVATRKNEKSPPTTPTWFNSLPPPHEKSRTKKITLRSAAAPITEKNEAIVLAESVNGLHSGPSDNDNSEETTTAHSTSPIADRSAPKFMPASRSGWLGINNNTTRSKPTSMTAYHARLKETGESDKPRMAHYLQQFVDARLSRTTTIGSAASVTTTTFGGALTGAVSTAAVAAVSAPVSSSSATTNGASTGVNLNFATVYGVPFSQKSDGAVVVSPVRLVGSSNVLATTALATALPNSKQSTPLHTPKPPAHPAMATLMLTHYNPLVLHSTAPIIQTSAADALTLRAAVPHPVSIPAFMNRLGAPTANQSHSRQLTPRTSLLLQPQNLTLERLTRTAHGLPVAMTGKSLTVANQIGSINIVSAVKTLSPSGVRGVLPAAGALPLTAKSVYQ